MSIVAPDLHPKSPEILIGATFTATPLEEALRFWAGELLLPHRIIFAPYQQLFQALLDPAGPFATNTRGIDVALLRLEDLAAELPNLERHAEELLEALLGAAARAQVPLLVCVCPDSPLFLESAERRQLAARIRRKIVSRLLTGANIHVLDADSFISRYQVTEVHDALAERAGHVPYSPEFFVALATEIIRTLGAFERKPVKVIALDCDNTLWNGVCGEDGPQGVRIDAGRIAFQEFLKQQQRTGILLAIASKNNEEDVRETFSAHPEMVLAWSDITAHRINWESKSKGVLELAGELNLSLDSFVFVDDDAKECAEVRQELPEVVTLQLPSDSSRIAEFLEHVWVFDHVKPLTAEDLTRSKMYAEQVERGRFEKQAKDLRDFLAGLRLEVIFAPATPETLPRVAQLTQRTNQMNTTLERYTESELQKTLDQGTEAFTVTVNDRFGSYGLVGAVLFTEQTGFIRLTNFLLSCRALGRGVEHRVLRHLAEIAIERSKPSVNIASSKGPRNEPLRQFLESILPAGHGGFQLGSDLSLDAAYLTTLDYPSERTVDAPVTTSPLPAGKQAPAHSATGIDFERIAIRLNSAAAILAEIDRERRTRAQPREASQAAPENETQQQLARIWCDLLALDEVGIDEDFFDLGGHSLLAVQLLSRIHRDLGIDLPDSVIYGDKLRIDNLSRAIELQQLGVSDQAAYDAMLAEIESLSDEEVAALLAEEDGNLRP